MTKNEDGTYTFTKSLSADTALTAVYVSEETEVEVKPVLSISADPEAMTTERIMYYLSWDIPESTATSVVNTGFIVVNKADYKEETFKVGTTDTNVSVLTLGKAYRVHNSAFAADKGSMKYDNTYVAATWATYVDATTGQQVTVYSDAIEVYKPAP
ncbi:MAG: hypothetical protein IJB98_00070 [Clostridia bacterium]|nr:hypothetical protein [Clostridia bacterium]